MFTIDPPDGAARRVRTVLGALELQPGSLQRLLANNDARSRTTMCRSPVDRQSVSDRLLQPTGNSLGLLSGVSTGVSFFDPAASAPRIHQYSVDVQRQLAGDMSLVAGYVGRAAITSTSTLRSISISYQPNTWRSAGS